MLNPVTTVGEFVYVNGISEFLLDGPLTKSNLFHHLCDTFTVEEFSTFVNRFAPNYANQRHSTMSERARILDEICSRDYTMREWTTRAVCNKLFQTSLFGPLRIFANRTPIVLGRCSESHHPIKKEPIKLFVTAKSFPSPSFYWSYKNLDSSGQPVSTFWQSPIIYNRTNFRSQINVSLEPFELGRLYRCIVTHNDNFDSETQIKLELNFFVQREDLLCPTEIPQNDDDSAPFLFSPPYPPNVTRKIALYIGASKYTKDQPLIGAEQDAHFIPGILRKYFKFEVISLVNLTHQQTIAAIQQFAKFLNNENVFGLLYMSGHGCYSLQEQYFSPVESPGSREETTDNIIPIRKILSILSTAKFGCLTFFDCCLNEVDAFCFDKWFDKPTPSHPTTEMGSKNMIESPISSIPMQYGTDNATNSSNAFDLLTRLTMQYSNVFSVFAAAPFQVTEERPIRIQKSTLALGKGERYYCSPLSEDFRSLILEGKGNLPLWEFLRCLHFQRCPKDKDDDQERQSRRGIPRNYWFPLPPDRDSFRSTRMANILLSASTIHNQSPRNDLWSRLSAEFQPSFICNISSVLNARRSCQNSFTLNLREGYFVKVQEIKDLFGETNVEFNGQSQPGVANVFSVHNLLHAPDRQYELVFHSLHELKKQIKISFRKPNELAQFFLLS